MANKSVVPFSQLTLDAIQVLNSPQTAPLALNDKDTLLLTIIHRSASQIVCVALEE